MSATGMHHLVRGDAVGLEGLLKIVIVCLVGDSLTSILALLFRGAAGSNGSVVPAVGCERALLPRIAVSMALRK